MFTSAKGFLRNVRSGFNGKRVPFTAFKEATPSAPPERFAGLVSLDTGNKEADLVGAMLIELATEGGAWQAVPWRMLRNGCLGNGLLERYMGRQASCISSLPNGEPIRGANAEFIPNPLRVGIGHLIANQLVATRNLGEDDYLLPLDALLACVTAIDRPHRHPVENFAFGS